MQFRHITAFRLLIVISPPLFTLLRDIRKRAQVYDIDFEAFVRTKGTLVFNVSAPLTDILPALLGRRYGKGYAGCNFAEGAQLQHRKEL